MADITKLRKSYDILDRLVNAKTGTVIRDIRTRREIQDPYLAAGPKIVEAEKAQLESRLADAKMSSDEAKKLADAAWSALKAAEAIAERQYLNEQVMKYDDRLTFLCSPDRDPNVTVWLHYCGDLHRAVQITRDLLRQALDFPADGELDAFRELVYEIKEALDAAWRLHDNVLKSGGLSAFWIMHGPVLAKLGKKKYPAGGWDALAKMEDAALKELGLDDRDVLYVRIGAKLIAARLKVKQLMKMTDEQIAAKGFEPNEVAAIRFRLTPKEDRRVKGEDETLESAAANGNAVAKALVKLDEQGDGSGNGHGAPANAVVIDPHDPRFLAFFAAKADAANLGQGQFAQTLAAPANVQKFEAEYLAWLPTFGTDGDPIAETVLGEAASADAVFSLLDLGQRGLVLATLPTMDDADLNTAGVSPMGIQHLRRFIPAPVLEEAPKKKKVGAHKNGTKGTSKRNGKRKDEDDD